LITVDAITNNIHLFSESENLKKIFSEKKFDKLAKHDSFKHAIKTIDKKILQSSFIYDLSIIELKLLKKYIKENLAKEFIVFFDSSIKMLMLFEKKSNDDLKLCVDYRRLNALTIKNRYSISLILQLFILLIKAKTFTQIDIKQVYYKH
jgi:hypothetical protein